MVKHILVTAAGSPGFVTLKKAIRSTKFISHELVIHGCDTNPDSIGLKMCDKSFVALKGSSNQYIPELLNYCQDNKIDLILPCADEELIPLAHSRDLFEKLGCQVLVSSEESLKTILDKSLLFKFCTDNFMEKYIAKYYVCNNINDLLARYRELKGLNYKVCVKPIKTHGSRGFKIISESVSKEDFFNKKLNPYYISIDCLCDILSQGDDTFQDLFVMEYLPNQEYSVDCCKTQNEFLCVPRTREIIKEGICVAGTVTKNTELINTAQHLYNTLGLTYHANIQFKYNSDGEPKLLEINPRFSGTMEHCRAAGINFVEVAIRDILKLSPLNYTIKWETKMMRVWNELFWYKNNKMFVMGDQ